VRLSWGRRRAHASAGAATTPTSPRRRAAWQCDSSREHGRRTPSGSATNAPTARPLPAHLAGHQPHHRATTDSADDFVGLSFGSGTAGVATAHHLASSGPTPLTTQTDSTSPFLPVPSSGLARLVQKSRGVSGVAIGGGGVHGLNAITALAAVGAVGVQLVPGGTAPLRADSARRYAPLQGGSGAGRQRSQYCHRSPLQRPPPGRFSGPQASPSTATVVATPQPTSSVEGATTGNGGEAEQRTHPPAPLRSRARVFRKGIVSPHAGEYILRRAASSEGQRVRGLR
jgi:hypothetical protein